MKCDSCLYTNTCDGWCIGYVADAETSKAYEEYKEMVADVKLEAKFCEKDNDKHHAAN